MIQELLGDVHCMLFVLNCDGYWCACSWSWTSEFLQTNFLLAYDVKYFQNLILE